MASISTPLAEISRQDLRDLSAPSTVASITDVKHLSSYNWIDAPTPTITVPGSPPLWSPPGAPRQLKKDSGLIYIAQNAARHPDSPLEPLFRALYITNPSFDIRSIDVVTDRNNVRKLLSFINPRSSRNGLEAFTIHVEVANNTAIFSREETATHEYIEPHEFKGFGHEFEKAYTNSQISGSTGYHRILSYRFGDLNLIIRHETDGFVGTAENTPPSNSKEPDNDSLSNLLESLSLASTKSPSGTTSTVSKLTVKEEGQIVPPESTLEIKTRVSHKPLDVYQIAPQLWISQTLKLVRAYHRNGVFQSPEVEDVAAPIKRWEERNETDLRKLAALIRKLRDVVKGSGGKAIVKYDAMGDKLVVSKFDGKKMLPEDLYSKWDDEDKSEAKTSPKQDAGAESAGMSVGGEETKAEGKSMIVGAGNMKGKKAAKPAREGEEAFSHDHPRKPSPAKTSESNSKEKGRENLASDTGENAPKSF